MTRTTEAHDISTEVASIHAAAYERRHEVVTTVVDDDLAVCVLRIQLSLAEELLVANGHATAVHDQRQAFEQTLAAVMRAAVERATGRTVSTYLTATHLDPDLTFLTFIFAPAVALAVDLPAA